MRTVTALRCHLWAFLAVVVDLGVVALIVITNKVDIELPYAKTNLEQTLQDNLPTFGQLIAAIVLFINKSAITSLITVKAKRNIASKGVTLQQLSYYDIICEGSSLKCPLTLMD